MPRRVTVQAPFLHVLTRGTTQQQSALLKRIHNDLVICCECALNILKDITESQVVGHVKAPLLKTVPVHGDFGDTSNTEYQSLHYYPLRQSVIDTIEIDIRDETGRKVSFERGRVIVKLQFRQKRYSHL
ncbi:hypothetical protein HOLleu_17115 [Holothuria leucospilota]|uniref:Uncharacterized protein n=1 Tax=Holothuria leucospilota TaxID=206669 RepID=A0A9Q1HBQ2_HOLLE|nr:hypothetical protein HOLleu_17115 [Holothuria leucospilota]